MKKLLLLKRGNRRLFPDGFSALAKRGVAVTLFLLMSASVAFAQNEKLVTINLQDVSLEKIVSEIKRQTGLNFLYTADLFKGVTPVSLRANDEDWESALSRVLAQRNFAYEIKNGIVVITRRGAVSPSDKRVAVSGKVVDSNGQPLPGVTVYSQQSGQGMITNPAGEFLLFLPEDATLLQVSFVGMETQYLKLEKGKKEYRVVLKESHQSIQDVVVTTGYQTINRKDMVGSYSMVKADDIKVAGMNTIDKMLQGQIAGLSVVNSSGRVGASPTVEVRGTSTFLGNASPLWVVDGIIQPEPLRLEGNAQLMEELRTMIGNQVSWLNPADIETITVLKDASATAIYGSRASNGVIVITTKKIQTDRVSVNYNGNVSVTNRPNYGMFNMMNSQERLHFSEEALAARARFSIEPFKQYNTFEGVNKMWNEGDISEAEYFKRRNELETMNTDWFKILTRAAVSQNHNVSVSGGTNKNNYRISLGYTNEQGTEIGNDNERYTAKMVMNSQLRDNIRLNVNMGGSMSKTSSFSFTANPLNYAINTSRSIPAFNEDGSPAFYDTYGKYDYNGTRNNFEYNILNERQNTGAGTDKNDFSFSTDFEWKMFPWLAYQFRGGVTISNVAAESYRLEKSFAIATNYRGYDYNEFLPGSPEYGAAELPLGGELYTNQVSQKGYNMTHMLQISKTFKNDHRFNALLGFELRSTTDKAISNTSWGYYPDRGHILAAPTPIRDLVPINGASFNSPTGWGIMDGLFSTLNSSRGYLPNTSNFLSYFATAAYSYKDRYVVNANIRNDMSNRFGQNVNKRFDPNYSFGVSWDISNEELIRDNVSWIDMMRVRATYGIRGNALTNRSNEIILKYGPMSPQYQQFINEIQQLPNFNLSWEKTTDWNIGLDLGLLRTLNVMLEYYSKESNSIVYQIIPMSSGRDMMEMNGGLIKNKGVELTVEFIPVNKKDFWLSVRLNTARNFNKVGPPANEKAPDYTEFTNGKTDRILKEGYPVGGFWSFAYAGLSPVDGRPLFNLLDVEKTDSYTDPTTFLVYSGQSTPNFTGGLQLSLRYKSFLFSSNFSVLLGASKRLVSPYKGFNGDGRLPAPDVNLNRDLASRWKKPGDEKNTDVPGFITSSDYQYMLPIGTKSDWLKMYEYSDLLVVDASFLRCQQLSLTWQMNQKLRERLKMQRFEATFSVGNPFTIASKRFQGFDPELSGQQVRPQVYSFGLNFGF